jgi:hypothetical protein
MSRGTRRGTSPAREGGLLAPLRTCHLLCLRHTQQEPIGLCSQRQGTRQGEEGGGGAAYSTLAWRVSLLKVRRASLLGRVSGPTCVLRLGCAASVYLSGGVGVGRKAPQASSFSCVTRPPETKKPEVLDLGVAFPPIVHGKMNPPHACGGSWVSSCSCSDLVRTPTERAQSQISSETNTYTSPYDLAQSSHPILTL